MTFAEFSKIMTTFTHQRGDVKSVWTKTNDLSVFLRPLLSTEKAKLEEEEIDYVLFIGGSAKNPLIQEAVKAYFPDSTHLIPSDLQAHVSKGAATTLYCITVLTKPWLRPSPMSLFFY